MKTAKREWAECTDLGLETSYGCFQQIIANNHSQFLHKRITTNLLTLPTQMTNFSKKRGSQVKLKETKRGHTLKSA